MENQEIRTRTKEGYQELCNMAREPYPITYKRMEIAFLNHPVNEMKDIVQLIGFAWSWMPRIPQLRLELLDEGTERQCVSWFQELAAGNDQNLPKLLHTLVPLIDNSVVGVSKMLYFAGPDYAPILDKRVVTGWNSFFRLTRKKDQPLRLKTKNKEETNIKDNIATYLLYRRQILEWQAAINGNVTIRDIEKHLFQLGGKEVTLKTNIGENEN